MKQATCAERIQKNLKGRLEDIETAQQDKQEYDAMMESILSIEKQEVFKVLLSTGGPEDFFLIFVEGEGRYRDWVKVEYWFRDWFDFACETLDNETAAQVAGFYSWAWEI